VSVLGNMRQRRAGCPASPGDAWLLSL
jgi:hypothetical protein